MRLPVLPSQCYSTSPDDGVEGRHGTSASRQPLRESTGNAQYSHMAWYSEQIRQLGAASGLASMSPSIPTPPIVPTQSFGPDYGSSTPSVYGRQQQRHHYQGHRVTNFRRRQFEENPLIPLLPTAFQNYRKKQADKTDQKWTDVLEWGFIDGKSYLQHEQCLVLFAKEVVISAAAYPPDEAQEIYHEADTVWAEHADRGVSLDLLPADLTARDRGRMQPREAPKASVEPHPSAQTVLRKSPLL